MAQEAAFAAASARSRAGPLLLYQVLCAAGLVLGVVVFLPATANLHQFALLLGAGYLVCTGLMLWRERGGRDTGLDALTGSVAVGLAPALVFAWHAHGGIPGRVVALEVVCVLGLATVTVTLRRRPPMRSVFLAVSAVASFLLPFVAIDKPLPLPSVRFWRLNSALYALKVTEYPRLVGPSAVVGGAVAPFRDRFVLVKGSGELFLVSRSERSGELSARPLPLAVPINWRDFAILFHGQQNVEYFRTADVLVQDLGATVRLFATHHYWKAAGKCFVVRVSMLEMSAERLLRASREDTAAWKTIFESTPCISLEPSGTLAHFGGIQIGGRLALLGANELLVALGDHEHDGINAPEVFSQDPNSSYGKTILLNLTDGSHQPYSLGHRNPQGLYADGVDAIWLTEHGPQGGDELNLIRRGANYGWPFATYGTQYGEHNWPGVSAVVARARFTEPFYSWIPSIGVSSLLVMHGREFPLWDGDLLIASLRDGAMYRARIREARVVMLERIPFGRRIRDVALGQRGQLLLWTDGGALLQIQADTEVGSGEVAFHACAGCHMIDDGGTHGIGPDLRKIVGRPVAAASGYRYSVALTELGGRWTRDRLDRFLADPQAYVPGTKMKFAGMQAPDQRRRLIEFLASGANNNPPPENE